MDKIKQPHTYINTGKGGVGKSTICIAGALHHALVENQKTLVIDADGGYAGARTLQHTIIKPNMIETTHIPNLAFAGIQYDDSLKTLRNFKENDQKFRDYMNQFPDDYGLVVFNDMLHEFFGAMTDVEGVHKFISLVNLVQQAKKDGYENIHIDVEPTSGFKRLINGAERAAESMENLSKTGKMKLAVMGAAGWGDIKSYLEAEYFKKIKSYKERIIDTRNTIVNGSFNIVSTAEPDPMRQATNEVLYTLEGIGANIQSLIINCLGRGKQEVENEVMKMAKEKIKGKNISIKTINQDSRMFNEKEKLSALQSVAEQLYS